MILAIVQARMSSTRLPGKVMKEILGKPVIGHVLDRLSLSRRINKIILATSTLAENDAMCEYVRKIGVDVYRGSEDNVLDRFYQVAKQYNPEGIVRLTADCPLIDPKVCDEVIESFAKGTFDYVATGPTFAEGVDCEVFSFEALKTIWTEAKLKLEQEHVTFYFRKHPDIFKTLFLVNQTDDSRYRFVVDEDVDFRVVSAIFEHFAKKGNLIFYSDDVKKFLDVNKNIYELNSHVTRNQGFIQSLAKEREFQRVQKKH